MQGETLKFVFPMIGKEFYPTFLFLETVKVRDNGI